MTEPLKEDKFVPGAFCGGLIGVLVTAVVAMVVAMAVARDTLDFAVERFHYEAIKEGHAEYTIDENLKRVFRWKKPLVVEISK